MFNFFVLIVLLSYFNVHVPFYILHDYGYMCKAKEWERGVILCIFLLNFKNDKYDKYSKISNTFLFIVSNKMLGYKAGT